MDVWPLSCPITATFKLTAGMRDGGEKKERISVMMSVSLFHRFPSLFLSADVQVRKTANVTSPPPASLGAIFHLRSWISCRLNFDVTWRVHRDDGLNFQKLGAAAERREIEGIRCCLKARRREISSQSHHLPGFKINSQKKKESLYPKLHDHLSELIPTSDFKMMEIFLFFPFVWTK